MEDNSRILCILDCYIPHQHESVFDFSCTHVPDFILCKEIFPYKAWCTTVISGKEKFVDNENKLNGKTWWDQRQDMIQIPYESWVQVKEYIIKNCKKSGQCDSSIAKYQDTIQNIDNKIGEIK
jgi:hypothetical protein